MLALLQCAELCLRFTAFLVLFQVRTAPAGVGGPGASHGCGARGVSKKSTGRRAEEM